MAAVVSSAFDSLTKHFRETALLASAEALLSWDEQTYLPEQASEFRADQLALLSGMIHQRRTDKRIGEWLAILAESDLARDPESDAGTVIREIRRDFDKQTKLPQALVEEIARTQTIAQRTWIDARKKNDFKSFAPILEKTFRLQRERADALRTGACRYDALLDDYEPNAKTSEVAAVLAGLRNELAPLIAEIAASPKKVSDEILKRHYPAADQAKFAQAAAAEIGFDFGRGRLDVTAHPFCTMTGPHDTRLTTRYDEHFFQMAFFGVLHEAGHGIYDQGLRPDWYGLPPGTYVSLGVHESQSRMWENIVGRSRAFWSYFFPKLQKAFPSAVGESRVDEFYQAINRVEPSLIRVEADEATYNLHIIIRFELEQALIDDKLAFADLPDAWRDKYQKYLGIQPPTDSDGCMQDIHWAAALVGYFATYSLGNLYSAQLFEAAERDLGPLEPMFARGEFTPLRTWLNQNIHQKGQCLPAGELVRRAVGGPLSHEPLLKYLKKKLYPIYGIG